MSDKNNDIYNENKHEHLIDVLFAALKNARDEGGLSLEEISQVIASVLEREEVESLAEELTKRAMEQNPLYKCMWCDKELDAEEYAEHLGICDKCLIKELEDKINTDSVERLKPDNENDF